jgi:methionine-rich copper-binding protein CopC/putative copper export protein
MRRRRLARRCGALAMLVLLVAPALPGASGSRVLAHAQLVASSPGAGEVVAKTPAELRLVFSEPLEAELTSVDLHDEDGTLVLDRAGAPDPEDPFALAAALPALPDGTYTVTWRTLSAADGHTVQGSFAFGVGDVTLDPADAGGAALDETDIVDVVGRWLAHLGLLGAIGLATFTVAVARTPLSGGLLRIVIGGLVIAGGATLFTALANAIAAGDVVSYLAGSRTGILQLARGAVCLFAAGLLVVAPVRAAAPLAIGGGLVGVALLVAGGHAAALPGPVPIMAGTVHVAAAGVWLGGVAGLALLGWRPGLIRAEPPPPPVGTCVPRFSALALVSIGLLGASGVVAAWWQTGAIVDPSTPYGRTLILKSALAVAAIAIGGLNYVDGGRTVRRLWDVARRARVEALLGIGVLGVTAVLATTSPSDGSAGVAIRPVPNAFGEVAPGMSLSLGPGRPGVNRVVVETTDTLAMSNVALELVLDRVDEGTTTRVELHHPGMEGMDHGAMGAPADGEPGVVAWSADALVLPADSAWDANVLVLSSAGTELARQRFAFAMGTDGIAAGAVTSLVNPQSVIAVLLMIAGAVGIGLAIGGGSLPRCDARASQVALRLGGGISLVLGLLVGADAILRL